MQFRHSNAPAIGLPSSGKLPGWKSVSPIDLLITAAFAILLVVQISRHEMWRDEIHSWGLVLASPSLSDLFGNLRFTGHPSLWYLILWLTSWFTHSLYAVQVVHAVIAIALIGMIGLLSPFSRLEKLLLLSSYFVLYEYTVISRNYGLGFLIALIYANMRAMRPDRVWLNACLLGLLANTNMFAFVLSGAFAFEYAVELIIRRGKEARISFKHLLAAAAVYLAFVAAAVGTMWPSPDISWRTTGTPLARVFDPMRLSAVIAGNVTPLLPIRPLRYWDLKGGGSLQAMDGLALPALMLVFFYIFKNHRRLLLIPGLTAVGTIAVSQLVYADSMRHWGVNFIAFVATLWIQRVWSPGRSYLVLALLAINAAAGIAVSIQQFPLTFSESENTAEWLRDNGLADAALVGTPDTYVAAVAQFLGKPMYFLDCSCTDTFLFYHKRRDSFSERRIPERLARAVRELQARPVIFLVVHPLSAPELAGMRSRGLAVTQLAAFDRATTTEDFFVYRVMAENEQGAGESN